MTEDHGEAPQGGSIPPQDYAGLRAELESFAIDVVPVLDELWPRLEDFKHRWELHRSGLSQPYDQIVASDITGHLIAALNGIGIASLALVHAQARAESHDQGRSEGR